MATIAAVSYGNRERLEVRLEADLLLVLAQGLGPLVFERTTQIAGLKGVLSRAVEAMDLPRDWSNAVERQVLGVLG